MLMLNLDLLDELTEYNVAITNTMIHMNSKHLKFGVTKCPIVSCYLMMKLIIIVFLPKVHLIV